MNNDRQRDLGKALRALRLASGRTGDAIARGAAMSAGKLSKIENGRVLPSVQDVDLILTALQVSDEAKAEFVSAARLAATEETAWRELRRIGHWKHQHSIQAVEAQTAVLRLFSRTADPWSPPDSRIRGCRVCPAAGASRGDESEDHCRQTGAAICALRRPAHLPFRHL